MPTWALILTIALIAIGLALAVAIQFCRGCGLVERRPWEGD